MTDNQYAYLAEKLCNQLDGIIFELESNGTSCYTNPGGEFGCAMKRTCTNVDDVRRTFKATKVAKNTIELDLAESFEFSNIYISESGWLAGAKRGTHTNTSEERRRFVIKVVPDTIS